MRLIEAITHHDPALRPTAHACLHCELFQDFIYGANIEVTVNNFSIKELTTCGNMFTGVNTRKFQNEQYGIVHLEWKNPIQTATSVHERIHLQFS